MNKAIICGRVTADVDVKLTGSNKKVCRFTLAVDDGKDANGERRTQYIDCVAWERSAEFMERYVRKGVRILVEGRLNKSSYERDGVKHYQTSVIVDHIEFADGANQTQNDTYSAPTQNRAQNAQKEPSQPSWANDFQINDSDLPF